MIIVMVEYYLTKDELYHHGIKGQKWGRRRWQNEDGSLTPEGYRHYGYGAKAELINKRGIAKAYYKESGDKVAYKREMKAAKKEYRQSEDAKQKRLKAIKTGTAIVGAALVAYGAYKVVNGAIANKNTDKYYARGKKYIDKAKNARAKYNEYTALSKTYATSKNKADISKGYKYMDKAYKMNKKANRYLKRGNRNINEVKRILRARARP